MEGKLTITLSEKEKVPKSLCNQIEEEFSKVEEEGEGIRGASVAKAEEDAEGRRLR